MIDKELYANGLRRLLRRSMPAELREDAEALLAKETATAYDMKSAFQSLSKRLVLALPREQINWHPTVDADGCVGCAVCHDFCAPGVYQMQDGKSVVVNPAQCVILCSNCMPKCPVQAITFPPQTEYAQFLQDE
ncbi:MAG: ferredoxin family protein [Eubacteriales bacterium]|nr:ferredoxin family protein [Eubacteriales bacterium]